MPPQSLRIRHLNSINLSGSTNTQTRKSKITICRSRLLTRRMISRTHNQMSRRAHAARSRRIHLTGHRGNVARRLIIRTLTMRRSIKLSKPTTLKTSKSTALILILTYRSPLNQMSVPATLTSITVRQTIGLRRILKTDHLIRTISILHRRDHRLTHALRLNRLRIDLI